jgi:aspartate/glutamate racemase
MHLGLIGGIGPAATEFYYRHLVRVHAAAGRPLELTIAPAEVRDLVQSMADGAPDRSRLYGGLAAIGRELCRRQGAEAVVLAGTDLFLAFEGRDCGFPTIDSARVHIDALARASMGEA